MTEKNRKCFICEDNAIAAESFCIPCLRDMGASEQDLDDLQRIDNEWQLMDSKGD